MGGRRTGRKSPVSTTSPGVEFGNEALGRHETIGVSEDGGDLVPINDVVPGQVQVDPQPGREGSTPRRGRLEEPVGLRGHQFLLDITGGGTPQGDSTIATVIFVVVAQRSLISNEEARGTVAEPFVHPRQRKGDAAHSIEATLVHPGGVWRGTRRGADIVEGGPVVER